MHHGSALACDSWLQPAAAYSEVQQGARNMQDLVGKVAFVTGAASGIGLGIAEALAQELRDPTGTLRAGLERLRFASKSTQEMRDIGAELERLERATDHLDDARLTLAVLAGRDVAAAPGDGGRLVLSDLREAVSGQQFYRVRAERP
jgi:NAD(P)-dependent dehydrogenase (short-subunit alcohol dehydrogenase family)